MKKIIKPVVMNLLFYSILSCLSFFWSFILNMEIRNYKFPFTPWITIFYGLLVGAFICLLLKNTKKETKKETVIVVAINCVFPLFILFYIYFIAIHIGIPAIDYIYAKETISSIIIGTQICQLFIRDR